MSREIDTRIVAMYFDNKDFEKNAKTTINTLGELKKGMNIEKSVKGFEELKKASEHLKLDDLERKVHNLKNSFGDMKNVIGNAFDIGTAPLRSIENLFSTFQSYVTKFIGFDLAGKLVSGIESAVRELTIAPVSAGWKEYELKMDSIKTIMSGSGESLEVVKQQLEELNRYADQTVYSFSDMTSNIGKFTNNKVKLEDATAAMKGIANATADAGQGAREASMAMYNISQAFGVGSMKMIDWKSLENSNIATTKLKDTFIQAGVAQGKLVKKMVKDKKTGEETAKYFVKGFEKGKKAVEVTVENFRETLNKEWLDKDTMLNAFKIYSGELNSIEDLRKMGFTEAMGFTDDDLQKMIDIGTEAQKAATEVRTFSKMWDALKEAAQSGWAQSLEFIFGDMEEGTSLWTKLNNKISEFLEAQAAGRNSALARWRGMYMDRDGNWRRTEDMFVTEEVAVDPETEKQYKDKISDLKLRIEMLKEGLKGTDLTPDERGAFEELLAGYEEELKKVEKEYEDLHYINRQIMWEQEDGREVLVKSFFELLEVFGSIGEAVSSAWDSVFGKFDEKTLWAITNGFRDFVNNLKAWLGPADKTGSRLNKISTGLKGVFSILKYIVNVAKSGFGIVSKLVKPLADIALLVFEKFGSFFDGLGNMNIGEGLSRIGQGFTNLWDRIAHLNWESVSTKLGNAWDSIKTTVREWFYDNGLGGGCRLFGRRASLGVFGRRYKRLRRRDG